MLRMWIYKALMAVVDKGVYSNLYLKDHLGQLDKADQALASHIFYGTLQNYSFCQAVWEKYASRKPALKIQVLLTMSVYQLLFLDKVPAYAVLNDANNIARKIQPGSAGFVNAVLRKVKKEDIDYPENPLEKAAFENSLPLWLVNMWKAQYGKDLALEMAESVNATLPVYVRRNPLAISQADFEADPNIEKAGEDLYIYTGASLANHPFYKEGKMSVQDAGSLQIARMLAPQPGQDVLDVCAAPGTKTMAMAEMMNNEGHITALDLHAHRANLIEQDASRLHISNVTALAKDSTDLCDLGLFDKVLCDVPCSGYGVLARKPDMKLKMKSEDMDSLIPLQKQLLEQAARHVKPGGQLVYSTCTLNKKENEKQVAAFLNSHPDFKLVEEKTLPVTKKQGGFYMACLESTAQKEKD